MKIFSIFSKYEHSSIFILIIFCSLILVIDSVIVSVYSNITKDPEPFFNSLLFTFLLICYVLISFIFIRYSRNGLYILTPSKNIFKFIRWIIIPNQFIISLFLIYISIQIFVFKNYELLLLSLVIYFSYISAIGYLTILTYLFITWYKANRNFIILIYVIVFSMIILNLILSLVYISNELFNHDSIVKLRHIKIMISEFSFYGSTLRELISLNTYFSLISFIGLWIPTIFLLQTYSKRVGKIKYLILICIPLLYFLLPFLIYEFSLLDNMFLEYGRQFNLFISIFLGPYQQVGGILFGFTFLILVKKTEQKETKILLRTAGIGITLLFGSTVITNSFITAPPFGLITISFVGIASYMLLIGIFTLSIQLSKNYIIRRELNTHLKDQFNLFNNIGLAETERLLERKVKNILKTTSLLQEEQSKNNIEDYREFIDEVLQELENRRKLKGKL